MTTPDKYTQHAALCGADMVNHRAVAVEASHRMELAQPVIHPGYGHEVFPAGRYISPSMQHRMLVLGVDYVVVHPF